MIIEDLKTANYGTTLEYQHSTFASYINNKINALPVQNKLLLCEHPPVITIGKHGKEQNLLLSETFLKDKGIEVFRIDRGGDITYHGPGQLVVYPIFDLDSFNIGLKQYIHLLEEIVIDLLKDYNIVSGRLDGAAGVWIDADDSIKARKICAIGVRSSHFVTMHGIALNVNTDLSYFSYINPCGFIDKGVTSIQKEVGHTVDMDDVKQRITELFKSYFKEKE